MAQTDSNLMERLKRAVYPSDPNQLDGDWNLRTVGGSGGTSTTDDSAFTPGSGSITPIGGYYGGRTVASGHVAAAAINGSGVLQVDIISGIVLEATVNITGIPTVNLGLGTVNIGNALQATVTLANIPTVNLGFNGKSPTMWLVKATAQGVTLIASGVYPLSVYGVKIITDATVDVYFMSPSGTAIEGTLRLLPGAGFVENNQIGHPLHIAPSGLFISMGQNANVGGVVRSY